MIVKLKVRSATENPLHTPSFCYRRIAEKSAQTPREYAQYLCFNIIVGSNDLCAEQQYTEEQQRNHDLIKLLHDDGMGYRKIVDYINEQGIKFIALNLTENLNIIRHGREEIHHILPVFHLISCSSVNMLWAYHR